MTSASRAPASRWAASRRISYSCAKRRSPSVPRSRRSSARRRLSALRVSWTARSLEAFLPPFQSSFPGRAPSAAVPPPVARRAAGRTGDRGHAGPWPSDGRARLAPGRLHPPPRPRSPRSWPRAARQWSRAQPSERPMVDGAPCGEPQAGDVSLPNLRSSATCAQRAHADRPRGRHAPPPARAYRVRACRPLARTASVAR